MMANFPFQRLQADLAKLIANTPAGSRLISEPDLAKQMGVSRATLREAMRTFETQGLIRRRQGSGTYVVGKFEVIDAGLEVLESLETMARRMNLAITVSDLHHRAGGCGKEWPEGLCVEEGKPHARPTRDARRWTSRRLPGRFPARGCPQAGRPARGVQRLGAGLFC
jgi:GntR family transcriptional regulator